MLVNDLKRWWQVKSGRVETPFDTGIPFWLISLLFHLGLLVLLAKLFLPAQVEKMLRLSLDEPVAVIDLNQIPEVEFNELIPLELGIDGDQGIEIAMAQAPVVLELERNEVDTDLRDHDFGEIIHLTAEMESASSTQSELAVKGSVGVVAQGASGAVDRITMEILDTLQQRPTTVVWLFDQSASMIRQRAEIQSRFGKIYQEVSILQESGHAPAESADGTPMLLTQVYGFGSGLTKLLSQPTAELPLVMNAIANLQRDDTGLENVMHAVITAANDHAKFRSKRSRSDERNVMIIIVTDEAGDDVQRVDEAVKICQKHQMPVFVIGVPAPFGRSETLLKWIDPDPDYDQTEQWARISQGPESVLPERLLMDLTGEFADLDLIDSGFGPFHLTRLSFETGGIYFAIHPNRRVGRRVARSEISPYAADLRHFFDPEVMRLYKPDYISHDRYLKSVQSTPHRQALVQASTLTTTGTLERPRLRFPKLDEARFVNDVTMAQRTAAIIEPRINRVYEILRVGEDSRNSELSRRWKAGYDLAIGQAIGAKLRAESYNAMLAIAKTKLKFSPPKDDKSPQNNTWVLRPEDSIETGSQAQKLMEKGKQYLTRVVEQHPGTPWAMLAQRELLTPMGWVWEESYTEPPRPREPNMPNNNNNIPNPERPMENQMPPPRREIPRL